MENTQDAIFKIIVGGVIAVIIGLITWWLNKKQKKEENAGGSTTSKNVNSNTNQNTVNVYNSFPEKGEGSEDLKKEQPDLRKDKTKILFIDDDSKFKVVSILKKSGWIHTKLIKDVDNLDDSTVKEADIYFVDIQGVGRALAFKDEGLGLALALRKKYSKKKIVIYSAEAKGDRFHEALRKADASLNKNAEPYEFQQLIEQYSKELYNNA